MLLDRWHLFESTFMDFRTGSPRILFPMLKCQESLPRLRSISLLFVHKLNLSWLRSTAFHSTPELQLLFVYVVYFLSRKMYTIHSFLLNLSEQQYSLRQYCKEKGGTVLQRVQYYILSGTENYKN